jgi:uncharacterized protein DUF4446
MPDLTQDQLTLALGVVGGIALIALLTTLFLSIRLRRVRRDVMVVRGDRGDRDLIAILSSWAHKLDDFNRRMEEIGTEQQRLSERDRLALSKFHMVRYDAFEDMGGRLSFSAALLDDHGDGVVLTSINGRSETRTYAKPIRNYSSDHNLTDEEGEAIAGAVASEGRGRQAISR